MNKKGWTRILIVIVAGLWAYNIYKTVVNYQVKTESFQSQENTPLTFAPIAFNKDTFDLVLPNQDPFLRGQKKWNTVNYSTSSIANSAIQNPINSVKPPINHVVAEINWPQIKYYGFLLNRNENHKSCMLDIDGRNYRVSVGAEQNALRIIEAYRDSVILEFNGEQKSFLK